MSGDDADVQSMHGLIVEHAYTVNAATTVSCRHYILTRAARLVCCLLRLLLLYRLLRSTLSCCTSYFALTIARFLLLFFVLFHIIHMHV